MIPILHFIILFTIVSITIKPHFTIANTNPYNLRGNESDYEALLAIKAKISDYPNSVLSSWNNSLHFCHWRGVTCGRKHKRVVSLELLDSNLVGTLSPFIGNLSFLHLLNLTNNSFRGHIPHQISHLPRLQIISMAKNLFEGEIPTNLSCCLNLLSLDLGRNKLVGRIPIALTTLRNLKIFILNQNNLSGRLNDIGIGNMSTSLLELDLADNNLQGSIPDDIGRLTSLRVFILGNNKLSGVIPSSLFNLSNLEYLYLYENKIHGYLPQNIGLRLPKLLYISLTNNFLTGQVPTSISNLSKIIFIDISFNNFKGEFSLNGKNLPQLSFLFIENAFSLERETRDLSFFDTLTNCTNLKYLDIAGNSFKGTFPHSILNFSTSLTFLDLGQNHISGQIPFGLGRFVNLYILCFDFNYLTGFIPYDIGKMKNVIYLMFSYNNISGEIPSSLGNLTYLSILKLGYNNLEGSLPKSLGNCKNLQKLVVSYNKLSGVLPIEVFQLSSLLYMLVNYNHFQGSLPIEISKLKNLIHFDVSKNRLSGEIPNTLSGCTSLTSLNMSGNAFVGSLPESLSSLKSIQNFDLSCNYLSGQIPSYFSTWPFLSLLNLSFNTLEGEVPLHGVFANTTIMSIVGNKKLCGGMLKLHLPKCPLPEPPRKRRLSLFISVISVLVIVLSLALCLYVCYSPRKRSIKLSQVHTIQHFPDVSYQTLLRATNGFSSSNLIGVGGFGSVYKVILQQGDTNVVVAVKVMNLQNKGSRKSFNAECKALRNISHKNLVKIITICSSIDIHRNDFKALVYEFMPRGNLESWLHSKVVTSELYTLSLFERLSIAIDMACALEYLHTQCGSPIVHCDLKPTNILLDDDMTAHVGDFGISKFLSGASISKIRNQTSSSQVRGTVGYVAPEYGLGSKVSTEGDVYSFGIIVLEMMTSKKPTDSMFTDDLNLHDFAKSALLSNRVMEITDQRMFGDESVIPAKNGADVKKNECSELLVAIGVKCSVELPIERMKIKDVVNELKSARQNLIYIRF